MAVVAMRRTMRRFIGPQSCKAGALTSRLSVRGILGVSLHCGSGGTADALASGASPGNRVGVQIPASAPLILKTSRRAFRSCLGRAVIKAYLDLFARD